MKTNTKTLILSCAAALLVTGASQASLVISDDFFGGTATDPVAGRVTPIGGATYYGSMQYAGTPSYAASLNAQDDLGLAFNLPSYIGDGTTAILNIKYQNAYPDGVFQTGFARAADTLSNNGVLYFQYAASNQTFQLLSRGTNVLASGSINLSLGTGIHDIKLTYDSAAQTASLSVDGTSLVNSVSTVGNYVEPITNIYNFSGFNAAEIHSLSVEVIPEPSSQNLLLVAVAASFGMYVIRRRSVRI